MISRYRSLERHSAQAGNELSLKIQIDSGDAGRWRRDEEHSSQEQNEQRHTSVKTPVCPVQYPA